MITETIEIPNPSTYTSDCINNLFYVPNAFSPNEDGENDIFTIHFEDDNFITNIKSVKIFNRWGALIFEKNNIPTGLDISLWNGFFKGKRVNSGVFIWVMELELLDGTEQGFSGDLTLVK